jgi:hypothetical protein
MTRKLKPFEDEIQAFRASLQSPNALAEPVAPGVRTLLIATTLVAVGLGAIATAS